MTLTYSEVSLNPESIKKNLQLGWVEIVFTKKDGSSRTLKGTTNFDLIPIESHPKKKPAETSEVDKDFEVEVKPDPNPVFNVYEEGKGWRSFRWTQVTKITVNGISCEIVADNG